MLIKEYRIPLPLTVEEYRIAQLYMIQKKSREETRGIGSGVEIVVNEPYENGPGGSGQYTYKIFHIGSHLPAWLRAILPSALRVEEEAWNAYPYTRTKYTCPFVERFVLDVETRYYDDPGYQKNVFNLSGNELQERIIDRIDLVKDPIPPGDYKAAEDPKLFKSTKTGRGPLTDDWVQQAVQAGQPIMCSYKLCKVEFRYWGMQTKIEKFIHEHVLRRTMLHAHRQAWVWQDEWYGLTIRDIRQLERQAQEILNEKMAAAMRAENELTSSTAHNGPHRNGGNYSNGGKEGPTEENGLGETNVVTQPKPSPPLSGHAGQHQGRLDVHGGTRKYSSLRRGTLSPASSQRSLVTPTSSLGHMDPLRSIRTDSMSDDEFFDANETIDDEVVDDAPVDRQRVVRWSSVEMLAIDEDTDDQNSSPPNSAKQMNDSMGGPPGGMSGQQDKRVDYLLLIFHGGTMMDSSASTASMEQGQSKQADMVTFKSTFEHVLKTHYPELLGRIGFRLVPCASVFVAEALTALTNICPYGATGESHLITTDGVQNSYCQHLAPAVVPLLASCSSAYDEAVLTAIVKANHVYNEFLLSEEGTGFGGEICIVGDAIGGLLAYDGLIRQRSTVVSRNPSQTSSHSDIVDITMAIPEDEVLTAATLSDDPLSSTADLVNYPRAQRIRSPNKQAVLERRVSSPEGDHYSFPVDTTSSSVRSLPKHLATPDARRSTDAVSTDSRPSSTNPATVPRLEFRVSQLFLCGAPLPLVLAYRQLAKIPGYSPVVPPIRPLCNEVYNLYYAIDPCCARLEPLLTRQFVHIPPVIVPRYQRFPLGDGQSLCIVDCLQKNIDQFHQSGPSPVKGITRRASQRRRYSGFSLIEGQDSQAIAPVSPNPDLQMANRSNGSLESQFTSHWWGTKRVDYALYCPEGLTSFPTVSLPNFLHASFWESCDVASFVIRQFVTGDAFMYNKERPSTMFFSSKPTEKWQRRRTSFKIKNAAANHRGNDVIAAENQPQVLQARFMYGSLDVVALTGEKVDIYIMDNPSDNGQWVHYGTETTDSHGRLCFTVPVDRRLPYGLYPVKMVVLGDHTYQDMYLTVVPPKTECVVFSIDGSFTASVSVSGKDPKVRAGAVDVVRHWQDLGYLILYVTARPDMQQRRVLAWLAQHNFPHGLLYFTDGISTEPLRHKTQYLKRLVVECGVHIQAGYGSAKDVNMYREVGLTPEQIFVVGKASVKKLAGQAIVLADGYAAHLNTLSSSGMAISRAAQGNGRLLIRKQSFGLPGQYQHRAVSVQRSHSFTPKSVVSGGGSIEKCSLSLTVPTGTSSTGPVSPMCITPSSQPTTPHPLRSPSPFTRLLSRKGRHSPSKSQSQGPAEQE